MYDVLIKSKDAQLGMGSGYVITNDQVNNLIGRLLTLIETLGLKDKQEKSFKDILKQEIWSTVNNMKLIDSNLLTLINNFAWEKEREEIHRQSDETGEGVSHPRSTILGNYDLSFKEVVDK